MPNVIKLRHPRSLASVALYQHQPHRQTGVASLFVIGYSIAAYFAYTTAGLPLAAALAEQVRLEALGNATANGTATAGLDGAGATLPGVGAAIPATPKTPSPSPASPKPEGFEWDDEAAEDGELAGLRAADAALDAANGTGTNGTGTKKERPLPSEWLPSAAVCVGIFLLACGHALFYLMCRWSIDFRLRQLYAPATDVKPGVIVCFRPLPHKGKPMLVPLQRAPISTELCCEFQRQKYEVTLAAAEPPSSLTPAAVAEEELALLGEELAPGSSADDAGAAATIRLVPFPTRNTRAFYGASLGLPNAAAVRAREERYGANILSAPTPRFVDLYIEQLLSPLAIFQIFCSLLWLLDAVSIGFTVFQLFTILLLESTTVFQRQRTLKTLSSMSAKPYELYVYRLGAWAKLNTTQLLPGDLISLKDAKPAAAAPAAVTPAVIAAIDAAANGATPAAAAKPPPPPAVLGGQVVPCDCVILRGSAVINEASLTGESVPQMKDRLPTDQANADEATLDVNGQDRVHALFAGTSVVASSAGEAAAVPGVPPTPDGGCLCYVVRCGFSSSQGELMQMIEFSQSQVSDDSRETLWALLLLLCFALAASAYVFKKGLDKGDRTTHELLLRCVIIITSVVPRQLPMQTALAVNTALMALIKAGVYCTEPYRVPFAGKIDAVLFDKTGTLTTDKLVPVSVINPARANSHANPATGGPAEQPVGEAQAELAVVLAGCHSLVQVEGVPELLGDPIETAALGGIAWRYDHATQTARPGDTAATERAIVALQLKLEPPPPPADAPTGLTGQPLPPPPPLGAQERERTTAELAEAKARLAAAQAKAAACGAASVRILHRHHFSSELQRMSAVVEVTPKGGGAAECRCLVKGSPEAVLLLLAPGAAPEWYMAVYRELAERGMRVLALAYKAVTPESAAKGGWAARPRAEAEEGLRFAGFIAFACKTRADSPTVIQALTESAHSVSMLTGDAPLTALHVAHETRICLPSRPTLLLASSTATLPVRWVHAKGAEADQTARAFAAAGVAALAQEFDLMATDASLVEAAELEPELWGELDHFRVFARMSPQGKAQVIRQLQQRSGRKVLMCGDGGNDVGALKQADVGLALLSGYGDVNTTGGDGKSGEGGAGGGQVVSGGGEGSGNAEAALNQQAKEIASKALASARLQKTELKKKQNELTAKQQVWMKEEIAAREARGEEIGFAAHMSILKSTMKRMHDELRTEQRRLNAVHGNVYDNASKSATEMMGEADTALPMVRPGDASVAAPFTSRAPSVRNIVDLIRQGRCTLLSALQQQQIMMLESLISAYVLSALSLEGARSSERQMIASSWLLMIASVAFSYATPVDQMHPQRPLRSLFHPAIFVSMAGQAAIHLWTMHQAVTMARDEMGPDKLAEVVEFHRKERLREEKEAQQEAAMEEGDYMAAAMAMWSTPFLPNLLNTAVFLVETAQCVAVLVVNYKGRPWMKGIMENHALFLSVAITVAGCGACAWGISPQLNTAIHLEPFPDDAFRWRIMGLVGASILGTFVWDRLCTALFAPEIFRVMMQQARDTRLKDLMPALISLGKVVGGLAVLASGNLLMVGVMWFAYKKMQPPAPPGR